MCLSLLFGWYMLEKGDLEPNGKLFDAKSEEGNGNFGDRKLSLRKWLAGHQDMRRQERRNFIRKRERERGINGYLGYRGRESIRRG